MPAMNDTCIPHGAIVTSTKLFGPEYKQVIGLFDGDENGVVTIRLTHVMRFKAGDCHRPADRAFTNRFPMLYTQAMREDVTRITAEERAAMIDKSHQTAAVPV